MRSLIRSDKELDAFILGMRKLEMKGRTFVAEFKQFRRQRTLKQNSIYWAWLRCIHRESEEGSAYTENDLHEYFSQKYLPWTSKCIHGQEVIVRKSTSMLDTKQFTEFLDSVQLDAMENFQCELITPEDPRWAEFQVRYVQD